MNTDKKKPAVPDPENEISETERALIDESLDSSISIDNNNLKRSALDITDADGDPLNENSLDLTGDDLDIPGIDSDEDEKLVDEDDEENGLYSDADTE